MTMVNFELDHGHVVKNFDHDHCLDLNITVVKWSKVIAMTMVKIPKFHGHMVEILIVHLGHT